MRKPTKPRITEKEFQRQVVQLAKLTGWMVHAERPAVNRRGRWSTPIQGDPGFPDLVLVRGWRILFVELKVLPNELTKAQDRWIDALKNGSERAGDVVGVCVWTPDDWAWIERTLARHDWD